MTSYQLMLIWNSRFVFNVVSVGGIWSKPKFGTKSTKGSGGNMSVFQCDKCGCIENSACTSAYHGMIFLEDSPATLSYKEILGLKPEQKFGRYCCVCSPIWFDDEGRYGIGPRPENYKSEGLRRKTGGEWHGNFERKFLPKGMFKTDRVGNLRHKDTGEPYHKWIERTKWDTTREDNKDVTNNKEKL